LSSRPARSGSSLASFELRETGVRDEMLCLGILSVSSFPGCLGASFTLESVVSLNSVILVGFILGTDELLGYSMFS
jgi:hypothetical protein